jgi:acetyl-CoA acetyltransferase family protein
MSDGGAAALLTTPELAAAWGLEPIARFVTYAVAGVEPEIMGIGPVKAVPRMLDRVGMALADIDVIELNEAFAAQFLACQRELKFDMEKANVNGGAIAIGHPIGATGARIVATLLYEMERRDAKRGLATLCVSGGMGMAMVFER